VTRLDKFLPATAKAPADFDATTVKLVTGEGAPAFGLGIKRNCEGSGKVFLMGQGAKGDWSELLAVEATMWNPLDTKVKNAWLGDFGNDGTPDLLLHAVVTSAFEKSRRTREFIVLASLGAEVEYRFFFTLGLKGTWSGDCQQGNYNYRSELKWETPEGGQAPAVGDFTWTLREKNCPAGCPGKGGPCASANEQGNGRFIWSEEDHAFLRPETRTKVYIIPDVDFGPGFRRLPR
jgi:hypothetical protein